MLTVKNTFKLFDLVNKHFHNDHDTRLLITEVEEVMDNKVDLKMNDFAIRKDLVEHRAATRQDYIELKEELKRDAIELKSELRQDITELRSELKQEVTELRSELKQDMSALRSELKQDMLALRSGLRADFNKLDTSLNLNLANSAMIMERTQKDHLKWMMGLFVAMLGMAVALIKLD